MAAAASGSLFAYGGTRFAPRRQVGAWSPDIMSAAADPGGLSADIASCGYGILDRQPLVFLRNLQSPEERGGYPYSIFLRFSEEFWKALDFNPHRLLAAILDSPSLLERLLHAPEAIDMASLPAELIDLSSRPLGQHDGGDDLNLLVAAAFQDGNTPRAVPAAPIAAPGALVSQWAADAAELPKALRMSLTFSYGNSPRLAALVGARLHLVPGETDPAGRAQSEAEPVVRAVLTLKDSSAGRRAWGLLEETPLHEWSAIHNQELNELRGRILTMAACLAPARFPERLSVPFPELNDRRPLAAELRQLYQERLTRKLKDGRGLDTQETVDILRIFSAAGEKLSPAIAGKIDPEVAAREFIRLDVRPDEVLDNADVSRSYYVRALRLAADPIDRELLKDAVSTGDAEVAREAVVQTSSYLDTWIDVLKGVRQPGPVLQELEIAVREKVRRSTNITNSVAYVLFGNDRGGAWLSRQGDLGFRLQVVRELVKLRRKEYSQLEFSADVLKRIDEWLDSLRSGPLGRDLPLDLMSRIAGLGGRSWSPFSELIAGADLESVLALEKDVAERERLAEDYHRHLSARKRRPPSESRTPGPSPSTRRKTTTSTRPASLDVRTALERYVKKEIGSAEVIRARAVPFPTDLDEERLATFLRKPEIRKCLAQILTEYSEPVSYFKHFFAYVLTRMQPAHAVDVVAQAVRRASPRVAKAMADELSLLRFPERKGLVEQITGMLPQPRGRTRESKVPEPLKAYCRFLVTPEGRKFRSAHLSGIDIRAYRAMEELLKMFED